MSTLKTSNIQDTSGNNNSTPEQISQGRAKAWINFDGTASTIGTGRDSFNVASVTDNNPGDYTINFTNDMANTNYAVCATTIASSGSTVAVIGVKTDHSTAYATDSITVQCIKPSNNGLADRTVINVVVFGD